MLLRLTVHHIIGRRPLVGFKNVSQLRQLAHTEHELYKVHIKYIAQLGDSPVLTLGLLFVLIPAAKTSPRSHTVVGPTHVSMRLTCWACPRRICPYNRYAPRLERIVRAILLTTYFRKKAREAKQMWFTMFDVPGV